MEIVINFFSDLLHIQNFIVLCDLFLTFRKRNSKYEKMVVFVATGVISLLGQLYPYRVVVKYFLYALFIFGLFIFLYEEKKIKLLFMSLWSQFLIACLDEISKVIVVTTCTILNKRMVNIEQVSVQIITLFVILVIGLGIKRNYKMGIKNIGIGYFFGFSVLLCVDSVVLIYLSDFAINKVMTENKIIYQSVFLFVAFGILTQIGMVIFLILQRNVYRENQQLASQYLNDQKKHYEYLETRERETKKFRHDLRNHMYMLSMFNQQRDHEMLDQYMEKMNGEIDAFGSSFCVNNGIVDAILNKFAAEAEKEGIELQVEGHFPMKCNIHAFHLCTIFSNLLNNALEAERESQGNTIRMSCRFTSDHIIVCIENDSVGRRIEKDGKFETTKKDKWNHGFGLENVKECVEQNEGELLIESEENTFRVTVMLNNEDK